MLIMFNQGFFVCFLRTSRVYIAPCGECDRDTACVKTNPCIIGTRNHGSEWKDLKNFLSHMILACLYNYGMLE